jgi:4a-hydroxytetrahydrobiopterin dehydratase
MKKYTDEEVQNALEKLAGWKLHKGSIEKNYEFKDFNEAFAFLTRTALYSEKANHHAEYSGVYNKVQIRLNTHDVGGISKKDIDFAKEIDGYIPK